MRPSSDTLSMGATRRSVDSWRWTRSRCLALSSFVNPHVARKGRYRDGAQMAIRRRRRCHLPVAIPEVGCVQYNPVDGRFVVDVKGEFKVSIVEEIDRGGSERQVRLQWLVPRLQRFDLLLQRLLLLRANQRSAELEPKGHIAPVQDGALERPGH